MEETCASCSRGSSGFGRVALVSFSELKSRNRSRWLNQSYSFSVYDGKADLIGKAD